MGLFAVSVFGLFSVMAAFQTTDPLRDLAFTPQVPVPTTVPPALPAVDVRWSESDPYVASVLLGVDADASVAYLVRDRLYQTERWFIDGIDWNTGERVSRWEATADNVHALVEVDRSGAFHPISGTFEQDIAKYAALLRTTHGQYFDGAFATSESNVLYFTRSKSGSATWLADESGRSRRKLADTFASSASFSPDGAWVTFLGCQGRCDVDGYSIFVARTSGGPARIVSTARVPGQKEPYGPWTMTWSPTGELLVLDGPNHYESHGAPDCVLRFKPDEVSRPRVVLCLPSSPEAGYHTLLGSGSDRILAGWNKRKGPIHWLWFSLDDGTVNGEGDFDADITSLTPWARPRLGSSPSLVAIADNTTTHEESLTIVDPKTAEERRLQEGAWRTVGAQGMVWLDDDRLLALRAMGTTTQLVIVHKDRL